jgi:enterochelin esterase family protein
VNLYPFWAALTTRPAQKASREQFTQAGVKIVYFDSPGTAHEWLTWRRCFKGFAPRLFR